MTAKEKYEIAMQLLKELNCPEPIMDALWLFGLTIQEVEIKLRNWNALSYGGVIDGECVELPDSDNPQEGHGMELP